LCAPDGARLHETAIEEEVIPHIRKNLQTTTTIEMPFSSEMRPHTWTVYFWNANEGVYGNVRGKFDPLAPSDQKSLGILTGYVIPS
jgi:hypothetical protein